MVSQIIIIIMEFKPFPSSGFGNATVEKSGSGSSCSFVEINGLNENTSNALLATGVPTPCIAVYTNLILDEELSSLNFFFN